MRSWWNEKDYLGVPNEKIITKDTLQEEVVRNILNDIGVEKTRLHFNE